MGNEKQEVRNYPANAIKLCIDQCERELEGRVYSRIQEEPLMFRNCCEFLLKTDELFDRCGYPQNFQEKRDFASKKNPVYYSPPKPLANSDHMNHQQGEICTVDIFINSRRKSGWQGFIQYEGAPTTFRSELELLAGIHDAIKSKVSQTQRAES